MDCKDILINCFGRNFVQRKTISDKILTIEELVGLCEDLYFEVDRLQEKLDDLEEDLEENYTPKSKSEQYGINDSDFI